MDLRHLFEVDVNAFNPYPIYTAVNKNCLQTSSERGTEPKYLRSSELVKLQEGHVLKDYRPKL